MEPTKETFPIHAEVLSTPDRLAFVVLFRSSKPLLDGAVPAMLVRLAQHLQREALKKIVELQKPTIVVPQ